MSETDTPRTIDVADLVRRLRTRGHHASTPNQCIRFVPDPDCNEAADALTRLEAEGQELRGENERLKACNEEHERYRAENEHYRAQISQRSAVTVDDAMWCLKQLEWIGYPEGVMCGICGASELQGHEPNCRLTAALAAHSGWGSLQSRVQPWMMACFGPEIAADRSERNHRFLEEALELVQALGCTQNEAHQLVDYTFNRPVGDARQEVGGVMITLAALCLANGFHMHESGEAELARIWTKVEQIRAKQAAKPKHSPLPQHVTPPEDLNQKAMRGQCGEHAEGDSK